jgi:hypothetical protein
MRESIHVELSPQQRDYLLTGLRYLRSSIALHMCDWTEEVESDRQRQYSELSQLETLLTRNESVQSSARL